MIKIFFKLFPELVTLCACNLELEIRNREPGAFYSFRISNELFTIQIHSSQIKIMPDLSTSTTRVAEGIPVSGFRPDKRTQLIAGLKLTNLRSVSILTKKATGLPGVIFTSL